MVVQLKRRWKKSLFAQRPARVSRAAQLFKCIEGMHLRRWIELTKKANFWTANLGDAGCGTENPSGPLRFTKTCRGFSQ
jgi:hypothetical protein